MMRVAACAEDTMDWTDPRVSPDGVPLGHKGKTVCAIMQLHQTATLLQGANIFAGFGSMIQERVQGPTAARPLPTHDGAHRTYKTIKQRICAAIASSLARWTASGKRAETTLQGALQQHPKYGLDSQLLTAQPLVWILPQMGRALEMLWSSIHA